MISIVSPTLEYVPEIEDLNYKYLIFNLTEGEKASGFIRIKYDSSDLQKIIFNEEIVIAIDNHKVIAYYLIGRTTGKPELDYQMTKARNLTRSHNVPFDKIGFGCQVCISNTSQNMGLFGKLLFSLTEKIKNKYTDLLCSISDENMISKRAHIKHGWDLIDSIETTSYFKYKINKIEYK